MTPPRGCVDPKCRHSIQSHAFVRHAGSGGAPAIYCTSCPKTRDGTSYRCVRVFA